MLLGLCSSYNYLCWFVWICVALILERDLPFPFIVPRKGRGYMCLSYHAVVLIRGVGWGMTSYRVAIRSIPDAVVDRGRGISAPVACSVRAEPCRCCRQDAHSCTCHVDSCSSPMLSSEASSP